MFTSRNNKIITTIQNIALYFVIIFFCAFASMPIKFFSIVSVFPNITSILIFYFFIIRSDEIPYLSIFIFGILFDIFNNFPLATTSLVWLLTSKFVSFLRRNFYTPNKFIYVFRDFSIFAFSNSLLQWLIFSILHNFSYPILNSLYQFSLDVLFFNFFYFIIQKIEEKNK